MIRAATLPMTAALVKCGRVTRLFVLVFRASRATLLELQAVCMAVVPRRSRSCARLALAIMTRPMTRLPARCQRAVIQRCRRCTLRQRASRARALDFFESFAWAKLANRRNLICSRTRRASRSDGLSFALHFVHAICSIGAHASPLVASSPSTLVDLCVCSAHACMMTRRRGCSLSLSLMRVGEPWAVPRSSDRRSGP